MKDVIELEKHAQLVRFFEKQSQAIGLSENAGRVLAVLYIARFKIDEALSTEEIAEYSQYSRSNVGMILSQLEALGITYGVADYSQTGRGRRRTLYKLRDESESIIDLVFKTVLQKFNNTLKTLDRLIEKYEDRSPEIAVMLTTLRKDAKDHLRALNP